MSSSSTEPGAALALDLDGTLVDPRPRQVGLMADLVAGTPAAAAFSPESFWHAKREGATSRAALAGLGVEPGLADALAKRWAKAVEEDSWLALDRLLPGVEAALNGLAAAGTSAAIVTARRREDSVRAQIEALGLDRWCGEVRVVDPAAAATEKAAALRELGSRGFVGDSESDAAAASEAGVGFVAVSSGQRSRGYLASRGLRVADSLAEALLELVS